MSIIYHYFDKNTFEPEKNYFSVEKVQCCRHETDYELDLKEHAYKWSCIGFNCIGWGCLVGLIFMITFSVLGNMYSAWYYSGAFFGIILFVGGIIFANAFCWPKENRYGELRQIYLDQHEEELWSEATLHIKVYNEEQERIAEAWRAKHPFEEQIRQCLLDPKSSVDIAKAAIIYVEEYFNSERGNKSV